ncbi:MAG TPA: AraC family transcriptional regulator ligand-binding domain-containing protein, partial [Kofleriaceae bacterium]|nr:AraC family transcriptional regulator ligand-binding domain-containing protein [Kofleriaceae bacterium]
MAETRLRADAGSTVGTAGAKAMLAFAQSRGVDVDVVLAELGLDAETLADPEGRIPLAAFRRAWEI